MSKGNDLEVAACMSSLDGGIFSYEGEAEQEPTETPEERLERLLELQKEEWHERWQEVNHAQKVLEAKMIVGQITNKKYLQVNMTSGNRTSYVLLDVIRVFENEGNVVINYRLMYRHTKTVGTNGRITISTDVVQASGEKHRERSEVVADMINAAYNYFIFVGVSGTNFQVKELTEEDFKESIDTGLGYQHSVHTIHATQSGKTLTA